MKKKAKRIASVLAQLSPFPHIVALQEIENEVVLEKLVQVLQENHSVSCSFKLGKYTTNRTRQKVAFLILNSPELVLSAWDSFSWVHSHLDIHPLIKPENLPSATEDLLRKNIWINVSFMGKNFLVLNFHLKASNNPPDIVIREQEAVVVQGLVQFLQNKHTEPITTIILGDFNDFDLSFPCAYPPQIRSKVLERITNGLDTLKPYPKVFYNCLQKVPYKEKRVSSIFRVLIDHILVDTAVENVQNCVVQKQDDPKDDRVSDHWPVCVDLLCTQ